MKSYVTGFKVNRNGGLRHQILIETERELSDVKLSFSILVDGKHDDVMKFSEYVLDEAANYCEDFKDFIEKKKQDFNLEYLG